MGKADNCRFVHRKPIFLNHFVINYIFQTLNLSSQQVKGGRIARSIPTTKPFTNNVQKNQKDMMLINIVRFTVNRFRIKPAVICIWRYEL